LFYWEDPGIDKIDGVFYIYFRWIIALMGYEDESLYRELLCFERADAQFALQPVKGHKRAGDRSDERQQREKEVGPMQVRRPPVVCRASVFFGQFYAAQ
jgi:hypothetical protein